MRLHQSDIRTLAAPAAAGVVDVRGRRTRANGCNARCGAQGFYDNVKHAMNVKVWKSFIGVMNVLPIAAIVHEEILACCGE